MKKAMYMVLALLFVGAGCLRGEAPPMPESATSSVSSLPFTSYTDEATQPSDTQAVKAPENLPVASQDAEIKTGERASASKNIVVSSLIEDQELPNPFVVLGRGRAFENVINWRMRDARGKILARGNMMTNAPDSGMYGAFRIRAFYEQLPDTETGYVDVYTLSPKDGAEQDMVTVPVRFPSDRMAVKVFFSNVIEDPQTLNCEKTYPVTRRIVKTQNVAEAALLELIKGPTTQEQVSGSRTSVIPGTILRSMSLSGDVVTVDFSRDIAFAVAGSCHVQALTSQIHETLKQFSNIKIVNILVEGESSDTAIQP